MFASTRDTYNFLSGEHSAELLPESYWMDIVAQVVCYGTQPNRSCPTKRLANLLQRGDRCALIKPCRFTWRLVESRRACRSRSIRIQYTINMTNGSGHRPLRKTANARPTSSMLIMEMHLSVAFGSKTVLQWRSCT